MNATIHQLNIARAILKREYPQVRAKKTVDLFGDLTPTQRGALIVSDRMPIKLLCQNNPR